MPLAVENVRSGSAKCPVSSVVVPTNRRRSVQSNSRTCTPAAGCPDDRRTRPSSSGSAPTLTLSTNPMKLPINDFIASAPLLMSWRTLRSAQQGEFARQDAVGCFQSVQVDAAGQGATFVVLGFIEEPVVARLLWPLVQDRHPLSGHRKQF